MATDARGHTVPAGSDAFDPQGADVAESLSINDWIIAANATDAGTKLTALSPTSARPAFVFRVDTGLAYTATGTTQTLGTDLFYFGGQGGTWTPTFTNLTVGNSVVNGWWARVGQLVEGFASITLGSTSSLAAANGANTVGWSLPVPAASFYTAAGTNFDLGTATLLQTGVQIYLGRALAEVSATAAKVYYDSGSPVVRTAVNSTAPFTWAAGNVLSWTFRYVAA